MSLGFWYQVNSVLYNHIELSRRNVLNWIASNSLIIYLTCCHDITDVIIKLQDEPKTKNKQKTNKQKPQTLLCQGLLPFNAITL